MSKKGDVYARKARVCLSHSSSRPSSGMLIQLPFVVTFKPEKPGKKIVSVLSDHYKAELLTI